MLLPMIGFFVALLAVGGLGSLVAMADPTRAQYFPYTMAMLFSGIGVLGLVFAFGSLPGVIGVIYHLRLSSLQSRVGTNREKPTRTGRGKD